MGDHVLAGHESTVRGCSLSAGGTRALTCSYDKTARLWDLADGGTELCKLEGHESAVRGCSLSADGRRVRRPKENLRLILAPFDSVLGMSELGAEAVGGAASEECSRLSADGRRVRRPKEKARCI